MSAGSEEGATLQNLSLRLSWGKSYVEDLGGMAWAEFQRQNGVQLSTEGLSQAV